MFSRRGKCHGLLDKHHCDYLFINSAILFLSCYYSGAKPKRQEIQHKIHHVTQVQEVLYKKDFKLQNWFKSYSPSVRSHMFCLVVELHWRGSATNRATSSRLKTNSTIKQSQTDSTKNRHFSRPLTFFCNILNRLLDTSFVLSLFLIQ